MHCPLCFLAQRQSKFGLGEMPFAIVRAAIENALKEGLREVIPSTMGEPLLYSHFAELLELCEASGVPLNLTTNGSFPGEWGTEQGMRRLLHACSDIKVSCMGFDDAVFSEMMPGGDFSQWKSNVERLVSLARAERAASGKAPVSTISLQVTLHKKFASDAGAVHSILHWAQSIGIDRIKWNLAMFLSSVSDEFIRQYALEPDKILALNSLLVQSAKSSKVRCEGSLFFAPSLAAQEPCGVDSLPCPFDDELWVLPDGSLQHCPNPERRYGNPASPAAQCSRCLMRCASRRNL
ncbi:radical SAM protein [uncultured Fibrobacter sp.]|uniref:radical SAM protein n=1 Tax=uncultured Fibrobacter sp. TaxID=261512 RepID=UPI0025CF3856|nr:radical SAM protein [uncultured Fibrobacter sp.]